MKQWRVTIAGKQYGPVSEDELKNWIAQGRVGPGDLVWSEGMPAWAAASSRPELGVPPAGSNIATPPVVPPPAAYSQSHRGGAVLALGILGLVVCVICGIIAWVMGNNDLRKMDEGIMDPSGRGITQAGRICGMISVIISLVAFVLIVVVNIIGILVAAHSA